MAKENQDAASPTDVAEAVVQKKKGISIVWLVPIVAILIGGWLAYKALTEKGPTIEITFVSAEGIEAGKTKIKYKEVEIGLVDEIKISQDLQHVILKADLMKSVENYLTETTQFWVVKARLAAGEVSGLGTLLSGAYIGMEPGRPGPRVKEFKGLEVPPVLTRNLPGRHFVLNAKDLGSVDVGTAIYYRKIKVGKVVSYEMRDSGEMIDIEIFIKAPYHEHVLNNTRFWNASGLDLTLDANGLQVNTESFTSMMVGGISFDVPKDELEGVPAEEETVFKLYKDKKASQEKIYTERKFYMIYFDSSVRGLSIGAPVEFRGIQVGEVMDVKLQYNIKENAFQIPVRIETERGRIELLGDEEDLPESGKGMEMLVEQGLRAQLKSGSMLTGQRFVDLDFHPDEPPAEVAYDGDLLVIPSIPAPMEELFETAEAILHKIEALPFEQIGNDLQKTVQSIEKLVTSTEITDAIKSLSDSLAQTEQLTKQMNEEIAPEVSETLKQIQKTLASIEKIANEDSPLITELNKALEELSGAARTIKGLTEYLERHPEALIKGKQNE